MPYTPLKLTCVNRKVAATISMFVERPLREAHNLTAANHFDGAHPGHFGYSAAAMTLLAIAATSAVRYFNLKKNKPDGLDSANFKSIVETFFPWESIGINDLEGRAMGLLRSEEELRRLAAEILYASLRNPLVHSGGVVAKGRPVVTISHVFPGLASFQENDENLCNYCSLTSLQGQTVLEFDRFSSIIHTRPLYWATRKMVEAVASDALVEAEIAQRHQIV